MPLLTASQFAIAFTFTRSAAAPVRLANGVVVEAAPDVPRFDHGPDGTPRGLLVTAGERAGEHDAMSFDPLMLPAALTESAQLSEREATVYHAFRPLAGSEPGKAVFEAGITRRAYYTREAVLLIDALMKAQGHHLQLIVHAGFARNRDGMARYRGQLWQLPAGIAVSGRALTAQPGNPLITSGAEVIS